MRTARSGPSRSSASTSWTASRARRPSGSPTAARVPVAQTSSTIPLDLVNNIVRRPYADRLGIIIGELGAGLAGRPGDLSAVLRRAHPGLRETNQTLRILARQTRTIERVVVDADTVVGALARRRRDVSRFVREAGGTAAVAATRRDDLAASFDRLPRLPGRARSLHGAARDSSPPRSSPCCANLRGAAGELDTFLDAPAAVRGRRRPGRQEPGPGVGGGQPGRPRDDRRPRGASPRWPRRRRALAKPLRQLLETIDDRKRAVRAGSARGRHRPARARQDPHLGRRAASPGWRRSGTTSSGRRSPPTRWTTSATCCG